MSTQTIDIGVGERVLPRPAHRPRRGARALLASMIALGVAVPIIAGVVTLPVESVKISGEFVHVSRSDIERAVEPMLASGLVRIDLDALRRAALDVPGVRDVAVRRVGLDSIEIWVVERVAVARWGNGGYLEIDGTHFTPAGGVSAEVLPVLSAPEGRHRLVLDLHIALARALEPLGMRIDATELSPRGVLYATLDDGPRLVMRPAAVDREFEIYARTLATVMAGRLHEVERVDFRYPSGFAVRMKAQAAAGRSRP